MHFICSWAGQLAPYRTVQRFAQVLTVSGCLLSSLAQAQTTAPEQEETQARFQATYIWQHHPSFGVRPPATLDNSKYAGDYPLYSLTNGADKSYTGSFTGYFGFRPWKGGELYFNPEITQGVPFTG